MIRLTGHLVDRALVVVHLVNEEFINLVHDRKGLFRTEFFGERRKSLHVAEHHRDLLAFPLDFIPLRSNLLSKAFGKVALDFVYFLVKR